MVTQNMYITARLQFGLFCRKYITFGTNLPTFASYKPQLFDVDSDPDELNDLADQHQDVAASMALSHDRG